MKLPSEETILKRLSAMYGFDFPRAFVPLLQIALEATNKDYFDELRFLTYYGFRLDFDSAIASILPKSALRYTKPSLPSRYPQSLPEYFVFGWLGADGVSYGYLVHAPELNLEDYPIVEEQPMVNDGLVPFGDNTSLGIEGIFSQELRYWEMRGEAAEDSRIRNMPKIQQVAERYGITPSVEKAPDYKKRYRPTVPAGWRFEATEDGVGVLAPERLFAPYGPVFANWGESPEAVFKTAREALEQGYPATALWGLRETFYKQWSAQKKDELKTLFKLWKAAYIALERPLFAKIVKRMAKL